jgi:5'-3' exonuclease
MKLNLIIDGNYALSKLVFTLDKHNLLYGALYNSLLNSIESWIKLYPFSKAYFVSDSKKSWRRDYIEDYKSTRKKSDTIDWDFVYRTYDEVKDFLIKEKSKRIKVLEGDHIEGDDWISWIIDDSNEKWESNLIISNDYDIKQKIKFELTHSKSYINLMINEMWNKEKVFLPKNYQLILDWVRKQPNNDIFSLNNNPDFIDLFDRFLNKSDVIEINNIECLLIKVISGDKSDNIKSIYRVKSDKSDRERGIGEKGAYDLFQKYCIEFGEPDIKDPDIAENFADLICEKKRLSKDEMSNIIKRFNQNLKLISLDKNFLPSEIFQKIEKTYNNL